MRKKGKLYKVTKGNMGFFNGDRTHQNIFDGIGGSSMTINTNSGGISGGYTPRINWSNGVSRAQALGKTYALVNNFRNDSANNFNWNLGGQSTPLGQGTNGSISGENLLASTGNSSGGAGGGSAWGAIGGGAAQAASTPFEVNGRYYKRGMYDALDPGYHAGETTFADGSKGHYENGAGNFFSDAGVQVFQTGASIQNPYVMLAGAALKAVGNTINNGWGMAYNDKKIGEVKQNTKDMQDTGNTLAQATTTSDLLDASGRMRHASGYDTDMLVKGGVFKKGDAREEGYNYLNRENAAQAIQGKGLTIGAQNVDKKVDDKAMSNFIYDLGGPLGMMPYNNNMGAIEYGFMSDYLSNKRKQIDNKGVLSTRPQGTLFEFGGNMQTNGSDFGTGLVHINAGKSHEENPNDGVQFGVDNEGTPNLVEEGETIYDDYVFSARIPCDETTKKKFHISKNREITYADLSKKLEKNVAEQPNDPIAQASFKAQMAQLAEQQERQKTEMEAQKAKKAFESLSPEEQTALMQQKAAQDEAMVQQQAMAEQQAMEQQPSPEEIAMAQQQQMADGTEAMVGQEPQVMAAYGGEINKYDNGGILKLLNNLGYKTVADAEKAGWKPSDFGYSDWKDINADTKLSDDFKWTDEFSKRLTSPEQKAMLSLGWNPIRGLLKRRWYEGDNGNSVGWSASYNKDALNAKEFNDYANRYKNTLGWAVANNLIKAPEGNGTVSMADIAKAMSQSPDWKKTDEWLYSSPANMATYLGMAKGLNDPDDAKFDNKWAPYGTFSKGENGKWTFALKDDLDNTQMQAFKDLFKKARTDNKVGVMYNNFHDPNSITNRYVLGKDGTLTQLTGDNVSDYEELGTYDWGDEANDVNNRAILYRTKDSAADASGSNVGTNTNINTTSIDEEGVEPRHRNETLRYTGLFGPAAGLLMQASGFGKPDPSSFEAAVAQSRAGTVLADYKPIGDYLMYRPMDIWAEQNRLDAIARAAERTIMNSSMPTSSKYAALLASNYNNQIANGNSFRNSLEYNDNLRKMTGEFNKDTNKFNADAYNRTSQFNAEALNRAKQTTASLALQAAKEKADADAAWYSSIYGNVGNLFKGLSDLGRENTIWNMIADNAADGVYGNLGDSYTGKSAIKKKSRKKGLMG